MIQQIADSLIYSKIEKHLNLSMFENYTKCVLIEAFLYTMF